MNRASQQYLKGFCLLTLILFSLSLVFAGGDDAIQVLKISPQDQRAVVKTIDGVIRVVKVGDAVGDNGTIIEIAEGRLVLEEVVGNDITKVIVRLKNGGQRVERMKRTADKQSPLYAPDAQNRK